MHATLHASSALTDPLPSPSALLATPKSKRRAVNFLEYLLVRLQRPEVILLSVWWLLLMGLVICLADLWHVLYAIGKPLFLLAAVPLSCLLFLCVYA